MQNVCPDRTATAGQSEEKNAEISALPFGQQKIYENCHVPLPSGCLDFHSLSLSIVFSSSELRAAVAGQLPASLFYFGSVQFGLVFVLARLPFAFRGFPCPCPAVVKLSMQMFRHVHPMDILSIGVEFQLSFEVYKLHLTDIGSGVGRRVLSVGRWAVGGGRRVGCFSFSNPHVWGRELDSLKTWAHSWAKLWQLQLDSSGSRTPRFPYRITIAQHFQKPQTTKINSQIRPGKGMGRKRTNRKQIELIKKRVLYYQRQDDLGPDSGECGGSLGRMIKQN